MLRVQSRHRSEHQINFPNRSWTDLLLFSQPFIKLLAGFLSVAPLHQLRSLFCPLNNSQVELSINDDYLQPRESFLLLSWNHDTIRCELFSHFWFSTANVCMNTLLSLIWRLFLLQSSFFRLFGEEKGKSDKIHIWDNNSIEKHENSFTEIAFGQR